MWLHPELPKGISSEEKAWEGQLRGVYMFVPCASLSVSVCTCVIGLLLFKSSGVTAAEVSL